ncbi:MAG TPA: DeoR family transcriptional regulator, partial [Ignavibacteria bacterium]|nr:DeoR family transcriptional regulator [Ignavibacteria bacterium]
IESAINFVKQNLKKRFEIDRETRRKEVLEIPEPAIREAIINAIVHRDYFVKGANVTVEIFNDRLMITNPGGLPKGFPENEFGNISLSRNPTIASLLLRAKYIEKMGTGINRIKSAFKKENLPDPIFEYNTFFKVIFKRKDIVFAFQKKFDVNKVLAERMTNILTILYRDKNIDIKEVAEIHNVSDRTIRNDLKKLFDLELVLTTGKSKSKKYFITIKGEDFVSENT